MKKKSIYDKKMEDARFKAVYDEVSVKLDIGEKIAELRHKEKMTQEELAKKVNTSRTAIARYESGKYNRYNVHTLSKIAHALHKRLKVEFV